MDQQYGFRASKRMFDARFKSWGVQKNLRRADKEKFIHGMTKATSFSENDMKKVKRFLTAQQRLDRSKSLSSSPGRGYGQSSSEASSPHTSQEHTPSSSDQSIVDGSPSSEAITSPQGSQNLSQRRLYNPLGVDTILPSERLDRLSLAATFTTPSGTSFRKDNNDDCIPMTMQLSSSAADRNVELLWTTMDHFISFKIQYTPSNISQHMFLNEGATDTSRSFWDRVENAIYQSKIGNTEGLAVPAFNDAKRLLQSLFRSGQVSLDFVRKALYTLSPTNTVMCSESRTELMKLIREYAAKGLGVDHPVTKVCAILLADEESSDLSRRALLKMYEMISDGFGDHGESHPASCKVMDSVITLARRTGEQELRKVSNPSPARRARELATAISLAGDAHQLAIIQFGLDSVEARQAAYTLAELYTVTQDHIQAHALRLEIVQRGSWSKIGPSRSTICEDAISAYTMESIAEHCEKENDYQGSTTWLARADSIASKIWDDSNISRTHISNKLHNACARLGESMISASAWRSQSHGPM